MIFHIHYCKPAYQSPSHATPQAPNNVASQFRDMVESASIEYFDECITSLFHGQHNGKHQITGYFKMS